MFKALLLPPHFRRSYFHCPHFSWHFVKYLPSFHETLLSFSQNDFHLFSKLFLHFCCKTLNAKLHFRPKELWISMGLQWYLFIQVGIWGTGEHQGWAGISISRDSREYKPQISLPFLWHSVISLPVLGKWSFGWELGREILSLFAVLRMAGQGMKIDKILNLTLLFTECFF